jgi:hypothetical protein
LSTGPSVTEDTFGSGLQRGDQQGYGQSQQRYGQSQQGTGQGGHDDDDNY